MTTRIRELDRLIFHELDDKSLLSALLINHYSSRVPDDDFLVHETETTL